MRSIARSTSSRPRSQHPRRVRTQPSASRYTSDRRAQRERAFRLDPSRLDLPRDEQRPGEDRSAPQARRLELDAPLREAHGVLDRGVDRRHLEGVVEGVEPPELRPRQAERRVPRHGLTKGFDGRGELRGLAREHQVVGPQERAIRSQLVERTPLVLLRESAGDDSLLGRDARRDHLRDGLLELARGVGWIGLVVLVRPDLAAIGDVDEAHADPQAALDLADGPTQREARAATRGPVRVAPPAAEDDAHVLVAAELGRQLLAEGSRRPRLLRGAVEGLDHDDGPVVQVGRRLRAGRPGAGSAARRASPIAGPECSRPGAARSARGRRRPRAGSSARGNAAGARPGCGRSGRGQGRSRPAARTPAGRSRPGSAAPPGRPPSPRRRGE